VSDNDRIVVVSFAYARTRNITDGDCFPCFLCFPPPNTMASNIYIIKVYNLINPRDFPENRFLNIPKFFFFLLFVLFERITILSLRISFSLEDFVKEGFSFRLRHYRRTPICRKYRGTCRQRRRFTDYE